MHLMYLMCIAAAQHRSDLEASYFVLDAFISKALLAAVQRGARVRIILPGKHIDSDTVRIASKGEWGDLFRLNDEASLNGYDQDFARHMIRFFEQDLRLTQRFTYDMWRQRPFKEKFAEKVLRPFKSQL